MRQSLKEKVVQVCRRKIAQKGEGVSVSFYAFFANRNDDPELLMEAATWWIQTHKLDHFERATKILAMVEKEASPEQDRVPAGNPLDARAGEGT